MSTPDAPAPFAPPAPLPAAALRWRCDPATLGFRTTAEVAPADGIVGQAGALEAVRFGLEIAAPGQNVYVRGLTGTGRLTLVRHMLEEIRPAARPAPDYAYVHDFEAPDRPRLLPLPRGRGEEFRERVADVRRFIEEDLGDAIDSDTLKARRSDLEREMASKSEAITGPLEADLRNDGLALVLARSSAGARPMVLPLVDGQPTAFDELSRARAEGKIDDEQLAKLEERADSVRPRVEHAFEELAKLHADTRTRMRSLLQAEAERVLRAQLQPIRRDFDSPRVAAFLDGIVHDLCTRRIANLDEPSEFVGRYEVNLVVTRAIDAPPPIIVENAPSVRTLVGTIDPGLDGESRKQSEHMMIHAGSLLRADGGVLVMEAREVLMQPGAWAALVRTLRTGRLELVPPDVGPVPWMPPSLKPEPVEIQVKVVLLGDTHLYYVLDANDEDFPHLFKVLADFDTTVPRDHEGLSIYAAVLARLAKEESLPPFDAGAFAALCEHGARIAAERDKLTARFGRLADIAREAAYLARKAGASEVTGTHVADAVRRTKGRADGPARRLRELIARGDIRIATSGHVVGQLNGLAVINAGPLTYGFPTRITATVAPGIGGAINIERESQLSGAIHTKAFYILGGLMRHLLPTEFPLTFEASIAFEQSYGGIDGDSASGAEICCLLSALTALPIDQRFAMTGAIDQLGNVLPIGAVNEKIEGYFDTCQHATRSAGVIIPKANVGDLMLRHDVVDACADGRFCVIPVDHIRDAIALFFGRPAGVLDEHGAYPPDSVLGIAMARAELLWKRVASRVK